MSTPILSPGEVRAGELAVQFAAFSEVAAVALGGSQSSGVSNPKSDIDLYVYTTADISLVARAKLLEQSGGATRTYVDLPYWLKTGQFKPTATLNKYSLKALIHRLSSLNDLFLSVAKTKPI